MYTCPITGLKLRRASAKGNVLWYSPYSRGRMITQASSKHYLGEDLAREIWVRSEFKFSDSDLECPSCSRKMRTVVEPSWGGGGEVNVCRSCMLYWIAADTHQSVPHPEDLLTPAGDSTVLKERAAAAAEWVALTDESLKDPSTDHSPPNTVFGQILGFCGLPVEEKAALPFSSAPLSHLLLIGMIALHASIGSQLAEIIKDYGFIPAEPLKNSGLNFLVGPFLHGSRFHLLGNMYFLWVFGDDLEKDYGPVRYVLLILFAIFCANVSAMFLSGSPAVPHIGFSGVIMAMIACQGLTYPKKHLVYLLPGFFKTGDTLVGILGLRWFRFPVLMVVVGYVLQQTVLWFALESTGQSATSYAGHIGGLVGGGLFCLLFFRKVPESPIARKVSQAKGLVLRNPAGRQKSLK